KTDLPLHAQPPSTSPQKRESRIAARRQFPEVSRCGRITAQPRYVVFERVRGKLFTVKREPVNGVFCPACAPKLAVQATLFTWLRGWWAVPMGPVYAMAAIVRNVCGGSRPREANARILIHQARAFMMRGDGDIARAVAEQARRYAVTPETSRALTLLIAALADRPVRRLRWRLRRNVQAVLLQLAPGIGLLMLAVLVHFVLSDPTVEQTQQTRAWHETAWSGMVETFHEIADLFAGPSVVPGAMTPIAGISAAATPAPAPGLYHVTRLKANVSAGPEADSRLLVSLDRFASVEVTERQDSPKALRVIAPGGVIGYMAVDALAPGLGSIAEQAWCLAHRGSPVVNGTVLHPPPGGQHHFIIRNTTHDDVLVKLKNVTDGRSVVALYVAADAMAQTSGIPDGTYWVVLATGTDFSRVCETFTRDVRTVAYPHTRTVMAHFEDNRWIGASIALTLRPPGTTYTPAENIPPERFRD
ncbi:MAG: Heat shock protein DnaJ-like, partial [Rhodospirillaceae bacterium]